jgi:hypothetical protein
MGQEEEENLRLLRYDLPRTKVPVAVIKEAS